MVSTRRPPPLTTDEVRSLGLTRREVDVLQLIALGSSTAEIAAALYLSVNSVKTHTQSVFRKLGVTTRLQAAVWVWSRDVEDDESVASEAAPRWTSRTGQRAS